MQTNYNFRRGIQRQQFEQEKVQRIGGISDPEKVSKSSSVIIIEGLKDFMLARPSLISAKSNDELLSVSKRSYSSFICDSRCAADVKLARDSSSGSHALDMLISDACASI